MKDFSMIKGLVLVSIFLFSNAILAKPNSLVDSAITGMGSEIKRESFMKFGTPSLYSFS